MRNSPSTPSPVSGLRRLFQLRCIALIGQWAAILAVNTGFNMPLPLAPLASITGLLALFNVYTWLRLRQAARGWPVSAHEIGLQLLVDLIGLAMLLFFTGGSSNPFISLFMLPLAIAAALLSPWYVWTLGILSVALYGVLMFSYIPLPPWHQRLESMFWLHLMGMWLNYALSALLIGWFVLAMSRSLRALDARLAKAREGELRRERVVALGTLAAGTAHELGTPLSTIAIIAADLEHDAPPALRDDIRLLRDQVGRCKAILSQMLEQASQARLEQGTAMPVPSLLALLQSRMSLLHPGLGFTIVTASGPAPSIAFDVTLEQALINLLNNAVDVSPAEVTLHAHWEPDSVCLDILDRGPGMTAGLAERLGQDILSSRRAAGMGIGVMLANATIERMGGTVSFLERDGGGALIRVRLPGVNIA